MPLTALRSQFTQPQQEAMGAGKFKQLFFLPSLHVLSIPEESVSTSLPGILVLFVLYLGFLIVCGRLCYWGFIPKLPQVHISVKEI